MGGVKGAVARLYSTSTWPVPLLKGSTLRQGRAWKQLSWSVTLAPLANSVLLHPCGPRRDWQTGDMVCCLWMTGAVGEEGYELVMG